MAPNSNLGLPPLPDALLQAPDSKVYARYSKGAAGPLYALPGWDDDAIPTPQDPLYDYWGIGYLGPINPDFNPTISLPRWRQVGMYDWLHNLVLPLYDQPDGKPQGWIACGWLLSIDGAELTQHSLQAYTLQTGYETYSFLVLDHVNGWLKIRYSTAGPIGGGAAWVPEDQLDLGPVDLTYVPWEERFRPTAQDLARFPGDGYYFFRHPQQPHGLRTAPAATASEILSIRGDHGLHILAIQGDWMQVRVFQPSNFCNPEWQGQLHEGWVRWKNETQGSLIYFYPRGC